MYYIEIFTNLTVIKCMQILFSQTRQFIFGRIKLTQNKHETFLFYLWTKRIIVVTVFCCSIELATKSKCLVATCTQVQSSATYRQSITLLFLSSNFLNSFSKILPFFETIPLRSEFSYSFLDLFTTFLVYKKLQ